MQAASFEPAYMALLKSGELRARVQTAYSHFSSCDICPWICRVDRLAGKRGICRTAELARVCNYGPHYGEEAPLTGRRGSGTIFFGGCNMRCQFCQNHDISQSEAGECLTPEQLAEIMLELQAMGCHNINLVSPTQVVPQILAALTIAAQAGLRLPLVYNTGGYDSIEALDWLDGVIDIYMPDMKYASESVARYYSKIRHYSQTNQEAVRVMYRQVGDLELGPDGIARHGLLVRHLVLPNGLSGTAEIIRFLKEEISPHTYLNLMDQYRPAFNARRFPKLSRPVSSEEFDQAVLWVVQSGFTRLDHLMERV